MDYDRVLLLTMFSMFLCFVSFSDLEGESYSNIRVEIPIVHKKPPKITDLEGVPKNPYKLFTNSVVLKLLPLYIVEGFSDEGMAFLIAQNAFESGYGDMKVLQSSIAKNNFWGLTIDKKVVSYKNLNKGYKAWKTMMVKRFPKAWDLLKGSFSEEEMQQALNPGKGFCNYTPGAKNYSKIIIDNEANILKRVIKNTSTSDPLLYVITEISSDKIHIRQ